MSGASILAQAITQVATPLVGPDSDLDPLVDRIGDARFVLIGEATHGTHEFYRVRADLTRRLIRDKGFCAVAAEADWPDAYRVNRFVRGTGHDMGANDALGDFARFPQWMWRNADVVDFVRWLRSHNGQIADPSFKVGFYGLDLYSLHASMAAVVSYLETRDPKAARRARDRYACFDAFGPDPQHYGYATALGISGDCEHEVLTQLVDLLRHRNELHHLEDSLTQDAQFEAEQNARVVARAEEYYRAMYLDGVSTWTLRDTHMADTLDALASHLEHAGRPSKIVVWAHNSHVGDSAATPHRGDREEITIGHLCRERHPDETVLVGLTTHHGTVTAASDWGGTAERKRVRPALRDSYEAVFHRTAIPRFLLLLDDLHEAAGALYEPRLQRAIGVIYRPDTERASHYFPACLPEQFDAIIHIDETRALEPLERSSHWERGEMPETYPSGL